MTRAMESRPLQKYICVSRNKRGKCLGHRLTHWKGCLGTQSRKYSLRDKSLSFAAKWQTSILVCLSVVRLVKEWLFYRILRRLKVSNIEKEHLDKKIRSGMWGSYLHTNIYVQSEPQNLMAVLVTKDNQLFSHSLVTSTVSYHPMITFLSLKKISSIVGFVNIYANWSCVGQ
jgi:hypothetical protein